DHRGTRELATVKVRESGEELRVDARSIVGRKRAVAGPDAHGLRPRHARHDAVECFVPSGLTKRVGSPIADQWIKEARWVIDDFSRRVPSNTEKPLAVRIFLVALDADELPVMDLGQHAAKRRMTVHRTHRADNNLCGNRGHRLLLLSRDVGTSTRYIRQSRSSCYIDGPTH